MSVITSWTGNIRSALGFWDFPEALRISGEKFYSPVFHFARWAAAELGFDNFISTVGLARTQMMNANGASNQVCKLQSGRVCRFRNHDEIERQRLMQRVCAIANAAKGQFQLIILTAAPALDNDRGDPPVLAFLFHVPEYQLQSSLHGMIIRADGMVITGNKGGFVDDHGNDGGWQVLHLSGDSGEKTLPKRLLEEKQKMAVRFSDFMLVKDCLVVTPKLKFEAL